MFEMGYHRPCTVGVRSIEQSNFISYYNIYTKNPRFSTIIAIIAIAIARAIFTPTCTPPLFVLNPLEPLADGLGPVPCPPPVGKPNALPEALADELVDDPPPDEPEDELLLVVSEGIPAPTELLANSTYDIDELSTNLGSKNAFGKVEL